MIDLLALADRLELLHYAAALNEDRQALRAAAAVLRRVQTVLDGDNAKLEAFWETYVNADAWSFERFQAAFVAHVRSLLQPPSGETP